MRKRISTNLRWRRLLPLLGIIFCSILTIFLLSSYLFNVPPMSYDGKGEIPLTLKAISLFAVFLGICFCIWTYKIFDKAKTVEFSVNNMIVTSKTEQHSIPLKNIFKIKITKTNFNLKHIYKIWYYNDNDTKEYVRILPRYGWRTTPLYFNEFINCVKRQNKDVIISHFSGFFDFDQ